MADPRLFQQKTSDNLNIKIFRKGYLNNKDLTIAAENISEDLTKEPFTWAVCETDNSNILTIESARFFKNEKQIYTWDVKSENLTYTKKGWQLTANNEEIIPINENSFVKLIEFFQANEFSYRKDHILLPKIEQMGNLNLPINIAKTLICPNSEKWMKEPCTLMHGELKGLTIDETSIEKTLKELNQTPKNLYTQRSFTKNFAFKKVIDDMVIIIGALNNKNWDVVDRYLEEPFHLDVMNKATINALGQTYEENILVNYIKRDGSVDKDFNSNVPLSKPITEKNLTPNVGLQSFIDAYQEYKEAVEQAEEKTHSVGNML